MTQRGAYRRNVGDVLATYNAADTASPDTFVRRSINRLDVAGTVTPAATTGQLHVASVTIEGGETVTNVNLSVVGASATQTAAWVALYSPTGVLLAVSADQTSTVFAANTVRTIALATPYVIKESGVYDVGICVVAGTMPTYQGTTVGLPITAAGERAMARRTTATYSTPATAPATLPTLTAETIVPYIVLT